MPLVITNPARPKTQREIERLVRHGVRDIKASAEFLGRCRSEVWKLVTRKELWSFRRGGKRLIPVVELRRLLAVEAMEDK